MENNSLDKFDFYYFHSPDIWFRGWFLFITYYAYSTSHECSEYYIFKSKGNAVIKKEKLFIESPFHKEFTDKVGFENFMLEKAIDEVKSLIEVTEPKIKELYWDKVDLQNYNIFLYANCKDVLREISIDCISNRLKIQLQNILGLKYHIDHVEE